MNERNRLSGLWNFKTRDGAKRTYTAMEIRFAAEILATTVDVKSLWCHTLKDVRKGNWTLKLGF